MRYIHTPEGRATPFQAHSHSEISIALKKERRKIECGINQLAVEKCIPGELRILSLKSTQALYRRLRVVPDQQAIAGTGRSPIFHLSSLSQCLTQEQDGFSYMIHQPDRQRKYL